MRWRFPHIIELIILFLAVGFAIQWGEHKIREQALQNTAQLAEQKLDAFRKSPVAYAKKHRIAVANTITEELCNLPYPKTYSSSISFSDSWGAERTINADSADQSVRMHEGCDLMYAPNEPGQVPILSMTEGVVEQKGWLTLGGYRIGIRSQGGIYYYYAHMASYAANLEVGDRVKAGQFLGFMGNTGYGKEGTTGKFAVHLHVGIYVNQITLSDLHLSRLALNWGLCHVTEENNSMQWYDVSVNPYPYLVQLQQ